MAKSHWKLERKQYFLKMFYLGEPALDMNKSRIVQH